MLSFYCMPFILKYSRRDRSAPQPFGCGALLVHLYTILEGCWHYQNLNRSTMRCHRRVKMLPSFTVSVSATTLSAAATVSAVL